MHILIQFIVGYLSADFFTGLFHWYEDNYLDYCCNIPFLRTVAKGNEMHHYYPRLIVDRPWWMNVIISLPIGILCFVVLYYVLPSRTWKKYRVLILTFLILISFSNYLHKIGHLRETETNIFIKILESVGLLQTHEYHSLHHEFSDRRYCAISQYLNPIFENLHFWKGLEHFIFILTGIKAQKKNTYDEYKPIQTEVHMKAKLKRPPPITDDELKELEKNLKKYWKCDNCS